ncbi:hypothetical protein CRENBAI_009539 [Crenichthys baileyi]|uniref:Transposase n=1 Tax=Crenichthys baileyi TaxID=28760 RepID=A0AAV9S0S1_9TELE
MPEDPSGLVDSSKDRAHGRLYQGDSQTLYGTGSRPARWGLTADGTPRERGRQSVYTLLDTTRPFDIISHLVSSIVRHYKSQWALRLVERGRPKKSDVTRDNIWKAGVLNLAFQLEISTDYHATKASSGKKRSPSTAEGQIIFPLSPRRPKDED